MSFVSKQGVVIKSFFNHNGNMLYPVTHNLIDLFWGRGFTNQARFKLTKGEWVLWKKTSNLPKGFNDSLQAYLDVK